MDPDSNSNQNGARAREVGPLGLRVLDDTESELIRVHGVSFDQLAEASNGLAMFMARHGFEKITLAVNAEGTASIAYR